MKSYRKFNNQMGIADSVFKTLGYRETDNSLDLATGLTRGQKNLIKMSWILIGTNQKENGVALFMMLFARYPAQLEYFQLFRNKTLADLEMSAVMRAHGTAVMSTFCSFVDNLDDAECLMGLVQKMAKNHLRRGISTNTFEQLRSLFSVYLEQRLGARATPEVIESWDKLLSVVNLIIKIEEDRFERTRPCWDVLKT